MYHRSKTNYSKDRNFQRNKSYNKMIDDMTPTDASKPQADSNEKDLMLNVKATSRLPRSKSSVTVKQDPYAVVLPGSDPYAILNSDNPKIGGAYGGKDNLEGGYADQLLTSDRSQFLKAFDYVSVFTKTNYKYLPLNSRHQDWGKGNIREFVQAVDEAMSVLDSTTFTNMAINKYAIRTSIPFDGVSNFSVLRAAGTPEALFAILLTYQIVLQSMAEIFNKYTKFRAYEGLMLATSWNRETPKLNSLFSLFNKNTIKGQFNSLSLILRGEYFDQEWMTQFNMVSSLVSRKSNAMTDPVKEILTTHTIPDFEIYTSNNWESEEPDMQLVFAKSMREDMTDAQKKRTLDYYANAKREDLPGNDPEQSEYTYDNMLFHITSLLSLISTVHYARSEYSEDPSTTLNDKDLLGYLTTTLDVLTNISNVFKPAMGDLRTSLDVLQRAGLNNWVKNTVLTIGDKVDLMPKWNLTVDDYFRTIMAGPNDMIWNEKTLRWQGYTLWHEFLGIPEYDAKSGGAFLAFSSKTFYPGDNTRALDYVPVMISEVNEGFNEALALNREGVLVSLRTLTSEIETAADSALVNNENLVRLYPLQDRVRITLPYRYSSITSDPLTMSFLREMCLKAFGFYCPTADAEASTDISVDPNYLTILSFEIEDLTQEMVTYARTRGPFIVNTSDKSSIGFLSMFGGKN